MAQGDRRTPVFLGTATSITNPMVANSAGTTVAVGDLIFAFVVEQTSNTLGAGSDNLGNTYTALTATVVGSMTYRAYYSRATVAGTLTQIRVAATASANNSAMIGAVFEGPFKPTPLDKNPTNTTADVTSPFTCPLSTTLAQADELVVCFAGSPGSAAWTASAPLNTTIVQQATASIASVRFSNKTVTATTSTSGEFAGTAPATICLGTATFMFSQVLSDSLTETSAIADAVAGTLPAVAPKVQVSWVEAQAAAVASGSLSESATIDASQSAIKVFADSLSESAATGHSQSATFTVAAQRAESAASGESQSAAALVAASRSESAAAAEAVDATKVFVGSLIETVTPADSQTVAFLLAASRAESAASGDSQTVVLLAAGVRDETAAVAEAVNRSLVVTGDRVETAALDHTQATQPLTTAATRLETAAIVEVIVSGELGVIVETAAIVDSVTAQPLIFTAACTETAAASEFSEASYAFGRSLLETATIADSLSLIAELGVIRLETVAIVDLIRLEGEGGVWIKHNGNWKQAVPFARHNGSWKLAAVYIKDDGAWKLVA